MAFEETTCRLEWKPNKHYKNASEIINYVDIIGSEGMSIKSFENYLGSEAKSKIYEGKEVFHIEGNCAAMFKIIMPQYLKKSSMD